MLLSYAEYLSSVFQNKKQRMMVRAAVLKMKDPRQIIRDMEKLDEMGEHEWDVSILIHVGSF